MEAALPRKVTAEGRGVFYPSLREVAEVHGERVDPPWKDLGGGAR